MAVGPGDGTTVVFGASGFNANVVSVSGPSMVRGTLDSTHLGTAAGFKTKIMSNFVDPGSVTLEVQHDANLTVPMTDAFETVTIDWGGLGDTYAASMAASGYDPSASVDEIMTATFELAVSGAVTGV